MYIKAIKCKCFFFVKKRWVGIKYVCAGGIDIPTPSNKTTFFMKLQQFSSFVESKCCWSTVNDEIVQEVAIMLSVLSNNWGGVARNSESSFYSTACFPVTVFSKQEQGIIPPGSHDKDGLSAIVQIHRLLQVLLFVFSHESSETRWKCILHTGYLN